LSVRELKTLMEYIDSKIRKLQEELEHLEDLKAWSSSILVYSVLCAGFGSALLASLLLYEKKSRV
jgi:hypothetical protein